MIKKVTPQRVVQRYLNVFSNDTENTIPSSRRNIGQVIAIVYYYIMLIV